MLNNAELVLRFSLLTYLRRGLSVCLSVRAACRAGEGRTDGRIDIEAVGYAAVIQYVYTNSILQKTVPLS